MPKIANKKLVYELLVSEVNSHQMANLVVLGVAAIRGLLAIAGIFYILRCHRTIYTLNAQINYSAAKHHLSPLGQCPGVAAIRGVMAFTGVFYILRCQCKILKRSQKKVVRIFHKK